MYHGGLLQLVHYYPGHCFHVPWFPLALLICRVSLALMFSNCRHPCLWCFGSVVPVSDVWIESQSIDYISFHSSLSPVPLACSETTEF